MEKHQEYMKTLKDIGVRKNSMRGRVLAVLFERFDEVLHAQFVAEQIKTTPTLGARGGETCTEEHVMANMTLGILQAKLIEPDPRGDRSERGPSDYRIIVHKSHGTLMLTTAEQAKGMTTDVYKFPWRSSDKRSFCPETNYVAD
jgi:hypothetical protein